MVGGDEGKGIKSFFDTSDEETYVARSFNSDDAAEMLVLPQLKTLLSDTQVEQWNFPQASIELINGLIQDLESGDLIA